MARQFKPVRFFVLIGVAAFLVCGVTAFLTKRAEHGRTSEERSAYSIGEKAGMQAAPDAASPTAAVLNNIAQEYFEKQGAGEPMAWKSAFARGYTEGLRRTRRER